MSHLGSSEGQQAFTQDAQRRAFNQSSISGVTINQGNNLMVNASTINMSPNNMMHNNAVAMGIVQQQQQQRQQQQQQMPMMWKGQGSLGPNPGMNAPSTNHQKRNQLPGSFAAIVPSNGIIPVNTQVESSSPIAPGSAPNIILAPEPINVSDASKTSSRKAPTSKSKAGKALKGSNSNTKAQSNGEFDDLDSGKTEKNRERNREHARSTRLRKKAYIQKLKDMAHGLRAVQTKEIRERRLSMQNIMSIQKARRAVVQTVLDYHASSEKDPAKWDVLLEESFWMKEPVTPFRSFRRSEVDRDFRIVRGTDAIICDAASIGVMVERIGCHNARWRRIKRNDFLGSIDNRDILNQDICIAQQPESSLSSESSTDLSHCSEIKTTSKRKRSSRHPEGTSNTVSTGAKISSSSESCKPQDKNSHISSDSTSTNTNTSSSDETDYETSAKSTKTVSKICSDTLHPPVLSRAYLNMVNAERISAIYAVNQDDMSIHEDVLMCPFVFRTKNSVLCGALADCVVPGMLRANFSKNNKLLSMELVFDAMGFMQQLDSANGGEINAQVIPGSLEMALVPCPNEARVITEAAPPYYIVHVNESWTRMTKYSQMDVEGKPLLSLLQGKDDDSGAETNANTRIQSGMPSHSLEEVLKGRSSCSTSIHYNKSGKPFVDFMCSYPLTNSTDEITHLLHVNMELPQTMTLIS